MKSIKSLVCLICFNLYQMNNLLVNCDGESSESKDLLKDYYNDASKFFNDQQNVDEKTLILRNNFKKKISMEKQKITNDQTPDQSNVNYVLNPPNIYAFDLNPLVIPLPVQPVQPESMQLGLFNYLANSMPALQMPIINSPDLFNHRHPYHHLINKHKHKKLLKNHISNKNKPKPTKTIKKYFSQKQTYKPKSVHHHHQSSKLQASAPKIETVTSKPYQPVVDDPNHFPHQYAIEIRWKDKKNVKQNVDGGPIDEGQRVLHSDKELEDSKYRLFEHKEEEHWHEKQWLNELLKKGYINGKPIPMAAIVPPPVHVFPSGEVGPLPPYARPMADGSTLQQIDQHFAIPTKSFRINQRFVDWAQNEINLNKPEETNEMVIPFG